MTDVAQRTGVSVKAVRGRAEVTAFIRQPYDIYRGNPYWVAPLETERRAFLDRRGHPFHQFADVELFLACRRGVPVGRIAAISDPRFNQFHGAQFGLFGLFECVDDQAVARGLFAAAGAWLRDRGHRLALGPMSFSTNYECGLLVEGFDQPPAVMIPYHPPHYARLLEACGFAKARDLLSWQLPRDAQPPDRIERIAEAVRRREDVTVRLLDRSRWTEEIAIVKEIYHAAWDGNWGFVPMTDAEFDHLARELRRIVLPQSVLIAEVRGEPAAVAIGLPDVNQALELIQGRLTHWGMPIPLLRLLWGMRRITRGRLMAVGVKEQFRRRGLDAVLYVDMLRAAQQAGIDECEISWTLEDNWLVNRAIEAMGGRRVRVHRIYEADLACVCW